MELKHQFTVPVTTDEAWEAFNDVGSIADCFPGATVTSVDGDDFEGTVKIKLGPISLQYAGTASFEERNREVRRLRIRAAGRDRRGQGTADATVTAVLGEVSDGTQVDVRTELAITGKPAQFGSGMIEDVSERLLSRFLDAFSEKMSADRTSGPPIASAESGEARSDGPGEAAAPSTVNASESAMAGTKGSVVADSGELNLLSTALPVVVRRSGGYILTGALFLVIGWLIGNRAF